ncbi:hypothetical protein [Amycolatopsis dendrobii]|uniref:Chitinase n=1 Tax=Amycolatopsis dendrobii TaxID=2760662 RepID=A0A7W3VRP0_9PSEU|nr:hypothetical protein [Amycolatopsis dendrobii]MBB1151983.1 hypothetical protein [Amycolatopsis dendrobii]
MKKIRLAAAALAVGLTMLAPAVADATPMPLTFGIYPGGYAGGGSTTGKPDNPAEIRKALAQLQSGHTPFLLRDYLGCDSAFPDDEMQYLAPGRRLDVVLGYSGQSMPEWQTCVERTVQRYGPIADTISVTLEQNAVPQPNGDTALVQGVIAGKKAAGRDGFDRLQIGFDEVAYARPFTQFWQHLAQLGGAEFSRSVGFVGVDLYPDSGLPGVPPVPDLAGFVRQTLHTVRTQEMPIAGLGRDVPIRVSENGWATHTAQRTPADQARALTTEILAVNQDRAADNVASYELFALRDDVTGSPSSFDNFGIMTDDYTPKPMYWLYQGLISGLSRS